MPHSTSTRRGPALVIAAAIAWILPLAVLASRFLRSDLPATVPSHLDIAGQADDWTSSSAAFVIALASAAIGAVLITFIVVLVGDDLSRFGGSAVLAGISLGTGIFSLLWFWALNTVEAHGRSAPSFGGTALWGVALAAVIFALGALRRPRRAANPPANGADLDH